MSGTAKENVRVRVWRKHHCSPVEPPREPVTAMAVTDAAVSEQSMAVQPGSQRHRCETASPRDGRSIVEVQIPCDEHRFGHS